MRNNKFLIGLSMGIVGCKLYDCFKEVLKPELVKVVGNAIEIGANTKNFFTEVTEKAQVLNKESYKKINYPIIEENEVNMPENIDNLKKQITEIQKKLSKL
jgi:hypothetical protein